MMKRVTIIFVITVVLLSIGIALYYFFTKMPSNSQKGSNEKVQENKGKILMIVAPVGYRDEELNEPKKIFENNGYKVVVGSKGVTIAKGMIRDSTPVDIDISNVNVQDYIAVVFVGGVGASVYFNDQIALKIAKDAVSEGKVLGAICIAPSILANAGVLNGRKATSFSSEADNLRAKGANYTGEAVTTDGKIVTANGPQAASQFGSKIIEVLFLSQ